MVLPRRMRGRRFDSRGDWGEPAPSPSRGGGRQRSPGSAWRRSLGGEVARGGPAGEIAVWTCAVVIIVGVTYAGLHTRPAHPAAPPVELSLAAPPTPETPTPTPEAAPEPPRFGPGPHVQPVVSDLPRVDVPADIPADCSVDVTERLNTWLAGVPDSHVIAFPRGGCYSVDGSLTLTGRQNLVIEGNETTFRAVNRVAQEVNRAQWHLDYGADLTLRNMTLSGVNPDAVLGQDTAFDHNVFVRGSHRVLIEHVRGGNTFGDFVAVAHGRDRRTIPSDVTVAHSWAENVGRMGVSCVACDGLTVRDTLFQHIALSVITIEVESDGWPARRIRIERNTIGSHGWSFVSLGAPFQTVDNDISDIAIIGNTMTEPSSGWCVSAISWIYTWTSQSLLRIEGNTLRSSNDAVALKSTTGVTVVGNQLIRQGVCEFDPAAVRLVASSDVDVRDNEVIGFEAVLLQ